jgi:hypothetical protein
MENRIKLFFDYLFYIGVTSEETSSIIIKLISNKYNNLQKKSINIDNLLKDILFNYLRLLTEDQLRIIGAKIYEQFSKNNFISIAKHLNRLIIIKKKHEKRKMKKYLNKWRFNSINSTFLPKNYSNYSISYEKNSNSICSNNFLNNLEMYNDKKKQNLKKLLDINEKNIMKNCVFCPNKSLNNKRKKRSATLKNSRRKNYKNIYEFLYEDDKYRKNKNEELTKKIDKERGMIFSPKINDNTKYINKSQYNFFERNQLLMDKKKLIFDSYCSKVFHS